MPHLQSKKITKAHSTLSELSKQVVNFLDKNEKVSKISIGVISNKGASANPLWTVKIVDETTCVRVQTTQKSINQKIRFYTKSEQDKQDSIDSLAKWVEYKGWKAVIKN